ncbi:MAG: YceI family protein [Bacteroidales bacterium]|jgi:polyisoprenoid-binding protein YceI|nr:YceI family protein [Bacteroidales bacterium]
MNKTLIITFLLLSIGCSYAQETYFTRSGQIYFISKTDAIDIDATNNQVASFFDLETGKIQFAVLIKSFEFTLATAKEHFNEEYMESDKFPKAIFKGEIIDFNKQKLLTDSILQVIVKGEITIRGITKDIEVPGKIRIQNKQVFASSDFKLSIDDFGIEVPKLVDHRVAKEVSVKVNMTYTPYKK